jgi:hypothetical protein
MTWSFGGRAILRVDCLSMGWGRGRGISRFWVWGGLMGVSVDKLDTDLFGEGKLNLLAGGDTNFSLAVGNNNLRVDNGGNLDGLFLRDISAGNDGKGDGFVNTDLLGGGVGNGDGDINGGDNGDIVGGFLGNLFAVVVSVSTISSMSMSISLVSGLADSDHLDVGNLLEGNYDGLGNGVSRFLFVEVCADFLGNNLDGFGTDGTGDSVCVWDIFNDLDGESDIFTRGSNGWGADLSDFSHINNRAVLFGFLITVSMVGGRVSISRGGVTISRGMVDGSWVIRGRGVSRGGMSISWGRVNVGAGQGKGKESQNCECL